MPSGTPALAHACAHPLCAAPDAPFVVTQFRSTTWPMSVISLPGVAACPETPFSEQSVGIDAIRAYWKDIPVNQADVTFKSGEIYAAGPWFATEFRCTYRRRRSGEWVDARGAMFCETKDGKITEMRMYWHRNP